MSKDSERRKSAAKKHTLRARVTESTRKKVDDWLSAHPEMKEADLIRTAVLTYLDAGSSVDHIAAQAIGSVGQGRITPPAKSASREPKRPSR